MGFKPQNGLKRLRFSNYIKAILSGQVKVLERRDLYLPIKKYNTKGKGMGR